MRTRHHRTAGLQAHSWLGGATGGLGVPLGWGEPWTSKARGPVEIRIEHPHLGDAVHRQPILDRDLADRLGGRTVIDAIALLVVGAEIGLDPGHAVGGVDVHDGAADIGAFRGRRDIQSGREVALHYVTGHLPSPFESRCRRSPTRRNMIMTNRRAIGSSPYFLPTASSICASRRPSLVAAATASPRERTPSLASTADTWWSTVFSATNSRRAMSALRRPSTRRPRTFSWRLVMPQGFCRVRSCAPRGMSRTPLARSLRRMMAAMGNAPSRSKISRAERSGPSLSLSASAMACS